MNVQIAARRTLPLSHTIPSIDPHTGRAHVRHMLEQIIRGDITGTKAHRWLGWVQACVCFHGGATLDELKEINHDS